MERSSSAGASCGAQPVLAAFELFTLAMPFGFRCVFQGMSHDWSGLARLGSFLTDLTPHQLHDCETAKYLHVEVTASPPIHELEELG